MTTTAMLETLAATPLLTPRQRDEVAGVLRSQFPEARALAQELLRRSWLTPYQANRLLQGRGSELLVGPYVVLERLGEGGMGEVFKARHPTMDRLVAVKKIRKDRLANPNAVQRFYQEVRAAARLAHPNVVYALDTFQAGDTHILVMEYVDGIDLARLVQKTGPLPVAQACEYVRQAALGLQHAHERGLVHRDIKPHNLLVRSGDVRVGDDSSSHTPLTGHQIKILDMGLARATDASEDTAALTQEGAVMGTPDYIAPEQARHSQTVDIRSDLYSLGCTLYFLLTGRPPFPTGTLAEKLLKHVMDQPEPVERLRPDVPPSVAAIVRRLLAKRPEDRFQTPQELADALAGQQQVQTALPLGNPASGVLRGRLATALPAETLPLEAVAAEASATSPTTDLLRRVQGVAARRPLWLVGGALAAGACLLLLLLIGWFVGSRATTTPNPTGPALPAVPLEYVRKNGRDETLVATLEANGRPSLRGNWHVIGPFDDTRKTAFQTAYPPEQEINLDKSYPGKDGKPVAWKAYHNFPLGQRIHARDLFPDAQVSCAYFYCPVESRVAQVVPVRFFHFEFIKVWLNGKPVLGVTTAQNQESTAQLDLQAGTNQLLIKIGSRQGWMLSVQPQLPSDLEAAFGLRWQLDFLGGQVTEGEGLKIVGRSQDFPAAPQDMRAFTGSWWRASAQLQGQPRRVGDWLDLELSIPVERRYNVTVCLTKAPSHGIIQLDLQGQPVGGRIDLFHLTQTVNTGPIDLGMVPLKRGPANLRVQVIGANERAVGERYGWGLDCISLR